MAKPVHGHEGCLVSPMELALILNVTVSFCESIRGLKVEAVQGKQDGVNYCGCASRWGWFLGSWLQTLPHMEAAGCW